MNEPGGGASLSTDPAAGTSSATDVSLREYFQTVNWWRDRFEAERDRRYAEVNVEKEKALKIKETADLAALQLAREIQTYKDEKANELREQINSERGLYATKGDVTSAVEKVEATIVPLAEYVSRQQGRSAGISSTAAAIFAVAVVLINIALYYAAHH